MKLKARVLSLLFALILCAGIALPAFADEDTPDSADPEASASSQEEGSSTASKEGDDTSSQDEGSSAAPATVEVPEASKERYYLDLAEILTAETKTLILEKNKALKGESEIVVVTINAAAGTDTESLSKKIFSKWEIGGKEKANGLLLVLDIGNDNYYALAGSGLGKTFTVTVSGELLETNLNPDFTDKKYDDGVKKTFNAFLAKMDTQKTESTASEASGGEAKKGGILDVIWGFLKVVLIIVGIILLLALGFVVLVNIRANQRKKRRRSARGTSGRTTSTRTTTRSSTRTSTRQGTSGRTSSRQSGNRRDE